MICGMSYFTEVCGLRVGAGGGKGSRFSRVSLIAAALVVHFSSSQIFNPCFQKRMYIISQFAPLH